MAGLVPNVGEAQIAKAILNVDSGPENLVLRLFKNDLTPTSTMTLSEYTEATFTGYSSVTLSSASWTTASSSYAYALYSSGVPFVCSATTDEDIYGFYLTGAQSSELYWSVRFTLAPYSMVYVGDTINPQPKITISRKSLLTLEDETGHLVTEDGTGGFEIE